MAWFEGLNWVSIEKAEPVQFFASVSREETAGLPAFICTGEYVVKFSKAVSCRDTASSHTDKPVVCSFLCTPVILLLLSLCTYSSTIRGIRNAVRRGAVRININKLNYGGKDEKSMCGTDAGSSLSARFQ